jgi:hypothetical protein
MDIQKTKDGAVLTLPAPGCASLKPRVPILHIAHAAMLAALATEGPCFEIRGCADPQDIADVADHLRTAIEAVRGYCFAVAAETCPHIGGKVSAKYLDGYFDDAMIGGYIADIEAAAERLAEDEAEARRPSRYSNSILGRAP